MRIPVAHDFICPWCYIGLFQARRLQREFGVKIEWLGYELYPKHLDWPDYPPEPEKPVNRPETPSRLALLAAAEGIEIPRVVRPKKMRTYNAHQASEFAKTQGVEDELIERLYRAYWEEGREINRVDVLKELATGLISDLDGMVRAIETDQFGHKIVDFDDDAYAKGVYNVPTFFIGADRLAEQPYVKLQRAMQKLKADHETVPIYSDLVFPAGDQPRPYTFINMVSTIDGKIITGERDEPVDDLGSKIDHLLMHRLESKADAILCGAASLRATGNTWNPKTSKRIVVTRGGNLPWDAAFLTQGEPIVAVPGSSMLKAPAHVKVIRTGGAEIDWVQLFERLRSLGIGVLNVLGGSDINAQVLHHDLADELFLTLAPKIKLGADTPTYAGGEPLKRHEVMNFQLAEYHSVGDEVFLRYRRPDPRHPDGLR